MTASDQVDVSITMPAYNEEANIERTVRECMDTLRTEGISGEVIVTNDGSQDGTMAVLEKLEAEFDLLRCIDLEKNLGKVPGASDIKIDIKGKTAAMTIKDSDEAAAVWNAVRDSGMSGTIRINGKEPTLYTFNRVGAAIGIVGAEPKLPAEVVLYNVHACCPECEAEIAKLLPGTKVSFEGKGSVKKLKITGKDLDVDKVKVWLGTGADEILVAENGGRAASYREEAGAAAMKPAEIRIRVDLGRGAHVANVWTCDFSYDYVKINADYRS